MRYYDTVILVIKPECHYLASTLIINRKKDIKINPKG